MSTRLVGMRACHPSGRRGDVEPEAGEDAHHLFVIHGRAENAVDRGAAERDVDRPAGRGVDVDQSADAAAGANLLDERARAFEGDERRVDVGAALEPGRGLGLEAEALARPAHRRGREVGALECHEARARPHLRRRAAHHAGDGLRNVRVGDDEHACLERARLAVERADRLARPGPARAQLSARQPLEVERVHRVPHLDQDVVGDVHEVVDGADAGGGQAVGQPGGRRPDRRLRPPRPRTAGRGRGPRS